MILGVGLDLADIERIGRARLIRAVAIPRREQRQHLPNLHTCCVQPVYKCVRTCPKRTDPTIGRQRRYGHQYACPSFFLSCLHILSSLSYQSKPFSRKFSRSSYFLFVAELFYQNFFRLCRAQRIFAYSAIERLLFQNLCSVRLADRKRIGK